jgi:hypothetical protein
VAWKHPELGTTFIPAKYMTGRERTRGVLFGATATGQPAPVVPLAASYAFNTYGYALEAPIAPDGYTALLYGGASVGFVPAKKDAKASAPEGYVAVTDEDAGTVFVPETLAPGVMMPPVPPVWGETAKGLAAPVVAMAPAPPVTMSVPQLTGGTRNVSASPPPEGWTVVGYAGSVAYLPAVADAGPMKRVPSGFIEVKHPKAGLIYLQAGYAPGGVMPPGPSQFGLPATGYAAPLVSLAPSVFNFAGRTLTGEPPPEGYTAVLYAGRAVSYVPAVAGAAVPDPPPAGFDAVAGVAGGTAFVPAGYAPGGARLPGYKFGAAAAGLAAPFSKVDGT